MKGINSKGETLKRRTTKQKISFEERKNTTKISIFKRCFRIIRMEFVDSLLIWYALSAKEAAAFFYLENWNQWCGISCIKMK